MNIVLQCHQWRRRLLEFEDDDDDDDDDEMERWCVELVGVLISKLIWSFKIRDELMNEKTTSFCDYFFLAIRHEIFVRLIRR